MISRMERYYKPANHSSKRSERNQRLYREIYDIGEYSNIEGIATIEKSNEVDITKIKNMLKNREQYQKQREFRQTFRQPEQEIELEPIVEEREEAERTYDIRDVLDRAKINKPAEEKYHSLDDTGYNILKKLKEKNQQQEEEQELRELIDTITNHSELNQLATRELSLDMFDELKSKDNTTIESKDAIKALLEEAKAAEKKKAEEKMEMDHSFYTSSLNFGEDDFEQLQANVGREKHSTLAIKAIVFVALVVATAIIIFLIYHLIQ